MSYQRYIDPQLSGQGRLQVGTYEIDVGRPAGNALIQIFNKGNRERIIEELSTDSSGQTPVINLAAPPLDFSMQPHMPQPYSEYDISVTTEGYEPKMIEGVQIFPDSTACQDIRLNPITEYSGAGTEIISIKAPTLWGEYPAKIPEDDVKELPPSTGYIVLPDPVVPEYIIVHDGTPGDTSAQNYWVPFKDYIKNVASCEIYSTWSEATIIANVLAILSFTLNRVYTEWYRGRGYDFTITSSTAYDHAFSYGRDIFEKISVVVDNIFTTFITKPGIRQPLLTQYCDGRKVSCPNWMTQWGSKDLGDQGYSAIDILKSFYGSDIYLMQTNKTSGVPLSYPGKSLQVGSTGPAVRTIQEQLNAISKNYPAIKKVRVDGIFGQVTRTAVETFQNIFRIPSSGIVDFPTWYSISNIYVAVTRMAELA